MCHPYCEKGRLSNLFFLMLIYLIYLLFYLSEFICILRNKMPARVLGRVLPRGVEILYQKFIYFFLGGGVFLDVDHVWASNNHHNNIQINRNTPHQLIYPL